MKAGLPPVIVIGMHRSGTALVARALRAMGVFVGADLDPNHEARFFRNANDWLLRQAGAAWDRPEAFQTLLDHLEARALAVAYLRALLRTPYVIRYLGWGRYFRFRHPARLRQAWGWKDPRNTFTLPIWLEIFPGTRVLHISRHGVDVAASLLIRQQALLRQSRQRLERQPVRFAMGWPRFKYSGLSNTLRGTTLAAGFMLWETYLDHARAHLKNLGTQGLEVRFEELLVKPGETLARLAAFMELPEPAADSGLAKLRADLQPERACAYRRAPELSTFAREQAHKLRARGFEVS